MVEKYISLVEKYISFMNLSLHWNRPNLWQKEISLFMNFCTVQVKNPTRFWFSLMYVIRKTIEYFLEFLVFQDDPGFPLVCPSNCSLLPLEGDTSTCSEILSNEPVVCKQLFQHDSSWIVPWKVSSLASFLNKDKH